MDYFGKANSTEEQHKIAQYKEELNLIIAEEIAERKTETKTEPMIESLEKKINDKDWVAKTSKEKQDGDTAEYLIVESKEGYEFIIEVNNEKETAKIIETNKMPGQKYTITYDPNGGTGEAKTIEVRSGFYKILEENIFTREDYLFAGWCEKQETDGTATIYLAGSKYQPTGNVTLYAIWTHNVATITFNNNTGTGTMDSKEVVKGKETTLPVNSFTKSGYDFDKWNTKVDGTGEDYADSGKIIINENTTLYAQWKKMTVESAFKKQEIFEDNTPILDANGKQVVIPGGFKIATDSAKVVTEGIVIEDESGNQFVWIPVDNSDDFVRVDGYYNGNKDTYVSGNIVTEPYSNASQEEKDLYTAMYSSVTNPNNKGFYIGRYEAGKEDEKVVVKKNRPVYTNVKWGKSVTDLSGGAVELSKNFINDKSYKGKVTSTLVYGVQWDTTLKFFNNEAYLKNGTKKGWYSDNYATGNPNHLTGIDVDSNASNKIKNVYDMAGNVMEWTMEAYNPNLRVYVGGHYKISGSSRPASNRWADKPSNGFEHIGFRLALYL